MARFYQTGETDFIDYEAKRPGAVNVNSVFGDLEALPEDRARLQELIGGFELEINDLATQLRKNPSALRSLQPRIAGLRSSLRDSLKFGEIAAIQDRKKRYSEISSDINKKLKNDPFLADQAIQRITVDPLGYDAGTRKYGLVSAPDVVTPFGANDKRAWRETAENVIKDRILNKVQDTTKLNATTDLLTIGQEVGVTRDQVIDSLIGQVTPEMIRSEQQELRFRGMDEEAEKEANFFDPETRKFDLSTTYGAMLNSMVEALTRKNYQGKEIQVKDDAAKAAIQARKEIGVAKAKGKMKNEEKGKIIADKLRAVYKGEDDTFSTGGGDLLSRSDNWLQDLETESGERILGIEKPYGGIPLVKIQQVDDEGTPYGEVDYRQLDMEFIQTQFGAGVADAVKEALGEDYDKEAATIGIDYRQDAKKTPARPKGQPTQSTIGPQVEEPRDQLPFLFE